MTERNQKGSLGEHTHMCDDASEQYYSERGFSRPVGRRHAGLLSLLTYFWVNPLLNKGAACKIQENTAEAFVDPPNRARLQAEQFSAAYEGMQVHIPFQLLQVLQWCMYHA